MKKIFLLLFVCISFAKLSAQELPDGIFLFDEFVPGTVVYKNGTESHSLLNYDKVDEKMYFLLQEPDSVIMEFAMTSSISYITIGDRTFVHIKEGQFYEKITVTDGFFFVRWKSTIVSEGKAGGYGTTSGTGAIDNASKAFGHSTSQKLASTEKLKTNPHNSYYLSVEGKFKRFESFNTLAKLFKKQKKEINDFSKTENLNFKKLDDVKKAVDYYYQISK